MAAKTTDPIDILLEMGIDLDNLSEEEDYLSALKEAIATIEFKTGGKGDERSAALRQEVIKVRKSRKAANTKFKAKKTTVKSANLFDRKVAPKQKKLPTSAIVSYKAPETEEQDEGVKKKRAPRKSDPLKDILKGINAIIATLTRQQKFSAKQAEKDRKRAEKQKREGAEDKLEDSGIKSFISGVGKVIKPVKGLLEGIFDFIKKVIIGRVLIKIIEWFADPDNKGKIEAIGAFFKNTWPALLAAYLLFGNSFTSFIAKMLFKVGVFSAKLIGTVIPALVGAIKRFGLGKSARLLSVVGGTALLANRLMDGGEDDVDLTKGEDSAPTPAGGEDKPETKQMVAGQEYDANNPTEMQQKALDLKGQIQGQTPAETPEPKSNQKRVNAENVNAEIDQLKRRIANRERYLSRNTGQLEREERNPRSILNQMKGRLKQFEELKQARGFSGGGQVPGSGPNRDTVPAMLAPGEFVMSRGAVQKYGSSTMAAMNAAGGGTNRPMLRGGVTYAAGGGQIGDKPSSSVEKPHTENTQMASNNGGFLGGLKSMFGFGGGPAEDKNTTRDDASTEEKSKLSDIQKKALQVLAKYESGAAGYDAVNQIGTKGGRGVEGFSGDIKQMPQHKGRSLTDFTIGEIKALQYDDKTMTNDQWIKAGKLHAVGAYQFIGNTLPGVAARAGIPDNAKFSPGVQDLMALQLMKERGISPWVGPSDKASQSERAIVEQARLEPISYEGTSGAGAIASFSGSGGASFTPPGSGSSTSTASASASSYTAGSGIDSFMNSALFKKSPGSSSVPPPPSTMSALGFSRSASGGPQQSANTSASQVKNQNNFPDIDANAMVSREKIKVLGLTVA